MKIQYLIFLLLIFSTCKKDQLLRKHSEVKSSQVKAVFKDGVMYGRQERMPVLKQCFEKDLTWKNIKKCSDEKLLEIIYSNLKMPEEVKGMCNFYRRVIVQFSIGVDGTIYNIRFPRKVEPYFEEETERLVCLLPEWMPGNLYGKDVEVTYTLLIKFNSENL